MNAAIGMVPSLDVRDLARQGRLARVARELSPDDRRILRADAIRIVAPVLFQNHTRRLEVARRHFRCARSFQSLEPDCLDRFHDDLEAVAEYLLRHANVPIANLEGWVTRRLRAATVDGHRRRRGDLGALQRPRLPGWLVSALGGEPRLEKLALNMLEWVGVDRPTTGASLWPIDAWAEWRASETGDQRGARRAVIEDVTRVLAAMRRRPLWYAKFVERPMGRKHIPVAMRDYTDATISQPAITGTAHADQLEAHVRAVTAAALDEIERRIGRGEDPQAAVVDVLTLAFSGGTGAEDLARRPSSGTDLSEALARRLADPKRVERILAVIEELRSRPT